MSIASNTILSNAIFAGDDDFSGGGGGGAVPRPPSISGGGSLIFIDPKTNEILYNVSSFNSIVFEMECKVAPLGGVSELTFRFSYTGSYPNINGAMVRIRVGISEVGYATLSNYSIDGYILSGTAISVWHTIADYKPIPTFYMQRTSLRGAIEGYALFIAHQARLEGYWWPIEQVIFEGEVSDYDIDTIDSDNRTIKGMLDTLAMLAGTSYDIRADAMIFRARERVVTTSVFEIDINPNLDTIVNTLSIHGLDRTTETIEPLQTVVDEASVRQYGTRSDILRVPFYLNIDYQTVASGMLTPQPKYTGSFRIITDKTLNFDDYFIPYYQRQIVITLANSSDGWSGDFELIDHEINNKAIKIDGIATYSHLGAIDNIRLTAGGVFTIRFISIDSISDPQTFNSVDYAYKDFNVGCNIVGIEISGNGKILGITGDTSQTVFKKVNPTEIVYSVFGDSIVADMDIGDGQSLVDFVEKLNNNQKLMRNFVSKE